MSKYTLALLLFTFILLPVECLVQSKFYLVKTKDNQEDRVSKEGKIGDQYGDGEDYRLQFKKV